MAQLAEQLICNQQVIGSSPIIGFFPFIGKYIVGEFPSGQRGQTVNLLAMPSVVRIHSLPFRRKYPSGINAGWSSLEARRAHNPKVGGSNPSPAIIASPFGEAIFLLRIRLLLFDVIQYILI